MSEHIAPGPPPIPPPLPREPAYRDADGPVCPECGAKRITSAMAPCWLCGAILPALDGAVPGGPVRSKLDKPAFVVIGVLVVLITIGLAIEAPGLLVVFALCATPALVRSVIVSRQSSQAGRPLTAGEKAGAFLGALGATVLVGAAAGVAFFATCFVVCLGMLAANNTRGGGELILPVSVFAGLVPGIFVFVWLLRLILRKGKPT